MSVKKVAIGDFIGYGTSFLAERKMKIATLSVILMVIAVR
jgi:alanine racemase